MHITPEEFDLVVVGTGLQEALIASAGALAGKKVLHLDRQKFYGDAWTGLGREEFVKHLTSSVMANGGIGPEEEATGAMHWIEGDPCLYENAKVVTQSSDDVLGQGQEFILDVAPKVTYQSGPLLDALIKTKAHHYVDYRLIEGSFVMMDKKLMQIPSSRSDIFKDRTLTAVQKRTLTAFLKEALEFFEQGHGTSSETMDFEAWLDQAALEPAMSLMVRSGVCFAEEMPDSRSKFEALGLYLQSAGRFKEQSGPFMVPYYGTNDLPQAFCRLCAVHGGTYVLDCGIKGVVYDTEAGDNIQVLTQYDQRITCSKLVLPAYYLAAMPSLKAAVSAQSPIMKKRISRVVCVIDASIRMGMHQLMVVTPRENRSAVYFLQVTTPSCPAGKCVLYGCCSSELETSEQDLHRHVHDLLAASDQSTPPQILFECYYNQFCVELPEDALPHLSCTHSPSGAMVGHLQDIRSAQTKFEHLFPGEAFLKVPDPVAQSPPLPGDSDEDMFAELEAALGDSEKE